MELMNWIWAAIALGSGLLIGEIAGRITRSALTRSAQRPVLAHSSRTIGNVVFWTSVLVGLVVAAALLDPHTVDEFGNRLSDEVPRLLLAGVWLIAGYAVSVATAAMVGQSARKATGVRQLALERSLRVTIMVAAAAAALHQAGVGSEIVLLVMGIAVAAPVATVVLLSALGGRAVAGQIAAGRALRHHLGAGDHVRTSEHEGRVVATHATSVEIETADGSRVQLPNTRLLDTGYQVDPKAGSRPFSG